MNSKPQFNMSNPTVNTNKLSKKNLITGLSPFTGTFGFEEAAHLLRRATMGATYADIENAVANGLSATVTTLLTLGALPSPPINYYDANDPNVPIGQTWINAPYYSANGSNGRVQRRRSIDGWGMIVLNDEAGTSIREKMTLFWHNHFAIESQKVVDSRYRYNYITLLRTNCLGNFKQLVKDITVDPAMVLYLDGKLNTETSPNENYAREILELFTIGKGVQLAPGDYSNYNETDVQELAKVFTGWKDYGHHSSTIAIPYSSFLSNKHDTTTKTLSYHFNNASIPDNGADEYKDAIDIIFQQDEVAYYICRKIYRWFVNFDLVPIEATVIEDMAQLLIASNYEIEPVMSALFNSQHFYDISMRGTILRNPLEFVFSVLRTFEVAAPTTQDLEYAAFRSFNNYMSGMNMQYYAPPDVAGWTAYYLEPQFSELWLNAVTARYKQRFTNRVSKQGFNREGFLFKIDMLTFITTLSNPSNPNTLINDISSLIYPVDINQPQKDYLKNILIPGLPDIEWTVEYNNYLANPGDTAMADSVANKLANLIRAMLNMAEFHMC